ncbi:MAG: hypothetical protein ACLGIJ_03785 [Candidatus Limnocylindria bacterium]
MVDESVTGGGASASICPWCSASYTGEPERCPSCGATLVGDPSLDPALPGLTALDPASILRAKSAEKRSRSRLLSWISGEYPEEASAPASEPGALAPPDPAVRREILRLEIEAEFASLQAEAEAIKADWMIEGIEPPADDADADVDAGADDAPASDAEPVPAATHTDAVPAATHTDAEPGSVTDAPAADSESARPS